MLNNFRKEIFSWGFEKNDILQDVKMWAMIIGTERLLQEKMKENRE